LGIHLVTEDNLVTSVVVRAYLQKAENCDIIDISTGEKFTMSRLSDSSFFEVFLKTRQKVFDYKFSIETYLGNFIVKYDSYSFLPTINLFDCHLVGQGICDQNYDQLGAYVRKMNSISGTAFAVWAPTGTGGIIRCACWERPAFGNYLSRELVILKIQI
jgi:1,4-alpha-glucan branching enzyme